MILLRYLLISPSVQWGLSNLARWNLVISLPYVSYWNCSSYSSLMTHVLFLASWTNAQIDIYSKTLGGLSASSWSSLPAQLFLFWFSVLKFKLPYPPPHLYVLKSVSVMCYAWVPHPSATVWKLPLETEAFIGLIFFYYFKDHSPGLSVVPILQYLKRFVYFCPGF